MSVYYSLLFLFRRIFFVSRLQPSVFIWIFFSFNGRTKRFDPHFPSILPMPIIHCFWKFTVFTRVECRFSNISSPFFLLRSWHCFGCPLPLVVQRRFRHCFRVGAVVHNRSLLLRLVREWYVKVPFTRSILNYIILEWGCLALYGLWQEFSGLGKRFACFHGCWCGQGLFQYLLLHSLLALIPPMYMETIDENYILECSFLKY